MLGAVFLQQYMIMVAIVSRSVRSRNSAKTQIPNTKVLSVASPGTRKRDESFVSPIHPDGSNPQSKADLGTRLKLRVAACRIIHPENSWNNPVKVGHLPWQTIVLLARNHTRVKLNAMKHHMLVKPIAACNEWILNKAGLLWLLLWLMSPFGVFFFYRPQYGTGILTALWRQSILLRKH